MDNFEKYNNIAAYKASQQKANTNPNLAIYEEGKTSELHVKIQNVWMDASYIPDAAPISLIDSDGFYQVQAFSEMIPIIRKVSNLTIKKQDGTLATFYDDQLLNAIPYDFGSGYEYELKDTAGNIVPFGLNNWEVDGNSGTLSFLGGMPNGYASEFVITFWRYCGRVGPDRILFNDGTTKMVNGYVPQYNKSIADKEYVDINISNLDKKIKVITPISPETFEGVDLIVSATNQFSAYYLLDNEIRPVAFSNETVNIDLPVFYNQEIGIVSLLVNSIVVDSFDLSTQPVANTTIGSLKTFHIEKSGYLDNVMVYKKIKMYMTINQASLPFEVTDRNRLTIQLRYSYNQSYFYSKEAIFGFESVGVLDSTKFGIVSNTLIRDLVSANAFISGVPAITKNDTIFVDTKINELYAYKKNDKPMFFENYVSIDKTYDTYPSNIYSALQPSQDLSRKIIFDKGSYSELFNFSMKCYKFDQSGYHNEYAYSYPIRIDTISDESIRVNSSNGLYPTTFGDNYDSSVSLINNNELQLIRGIFKWPSGNYTANGVFVNQSLKNVVQLKGPNYDTISKSGIRWATFKFTIPVCNGVYVSLNDLTGASEDVDTHELKNMYLFVKVLDKSGWLNANAPYDGVSVPAIDNDYCLVPHGSTISKKKITFGKKAIGGTIFIRVGFINDTGITFSGASILPTS